MPNWSMSSSVPPNVSNWSMQLHHRAESSGSRVDTHAEVARWAHDNAGGRHGSSGSAAHHGAIENEERGAAYYEAYRCALD
ncbi:hypothetical protein MRX96_031931 [Rhipicephalus microplus]